MSKRAELDLSLGARVPVSALPPAKTPPPAKRIERLKQTRQLIVILDRLSLRGAEPSDFAEPLHILLNGVQHKGVSLTDGRFYRVRRINGRFFGHIDELKYPKRGAKKGRANRQDEPMLYAAYSEKAAFVEKGAKVGETFALAAIAKHPGHRDPIQFFPIAMPQSSPYATPIRNKAEQLVHDYLNREMAKPVAAGQEHEYNPTIAITENFLSKPTFDPRNWNQSQPVYPAVGLVYPSVRASEPYDDNSYNIVVRPDVFDAHYGIIEVHACTIVSEPGRRWAVRPIATATISKDGALQWHEAGSATSYARGP